MEGDAVIPSFNFYGAKARKRSLHVKRSLEQQVKKFKEERCPTVFHSRIQGPSTLWQIFFRQQDAFEFARGKSEDLHVFAFESRQPGKDAGQRQYLTASYPAFWHYYKQLEDSQRHHYEVIPEGAPCKLYFDLEYYTEVNPESSGKNMVNTLIKLICSCLRAVLGVECSRESVLDLDASTSAKFSRHLIFHMENAVFKDNIHAGAFVRTVFSVLEAHLVSTDGEGKSNMDQGNQLKTGGGVNAHPFGVHETVAAAATDSQNRQRSGADGNGLNTDVHVSHLDDWDTFDLVLTAFSDDDNDMESPVTGQDGFHEERFNETDLEVRRSAPPGNSLHLQQSTESLQAKQTCVTEGCAVTDKTAGSKTEVRGFDGQTSHTDRPQDEASEEQAADVESQPSENHQSKIQSVIQQFTLQELQSMFVKDKDRRNTCFADLGVYTKNRNFRLYKSCKLGKNNPFGLSPDNTFTPPCHEGEVDQAIFNASLIANTSLDSGTKILTFSVDPSLTGRTRQRRGESATAATRSLSQESTECLEGFTKSPYPEVDEFILGLVSGEGRGGFIRRWRYFPQAEILSYDIVGYRFCFNVQRQHRSNNIKLIVDLKKGVWYQKCHDPDCRDANFKSEEFSLPENTLPAHFFEENDFEEELNLVSEDSQSATCDDFGAEETEDAACLAALEEIETQLASSVANGLSTEQS